MTDQVTIVMSREEAKYVRALINGNEGELNRRGWGHGSSAKFGVYSKVSDAIDDRNEEPRVFWPEDLSLDGTEIVRCTHNLRGGEAHGWHFYQCGRLTDHEGPHKAFRGNSKECFLEEG